MDPTNTSFMIICCALVFFMTPGLAFFYAGFDKKSNVINLILQNILTIAVSSILWVTVGYSLCFSGDVLGVIGNLDHIFLRGVKPSTLFVDSNIPLFVFISYQMMFAIITPALMTGAFTRRMKTPAYLIFITLWQIFVYYPFVHMIWGGGLLAQMGVLDFAGGIVVHASAGFGALACVSYLGGRSTQDSVSHNIPFVVLGTAILWFGWFGFNAGSALAANNIASVAFLNSQIAASFAAFVWFLINWYQTKKPQLLSFCVGSIAGLATITPCAGFVSPQASMAIGIIAGGACYGCVALVRSKFDDALDVVGVHGMGGVIGTILLGVFASKKINPEGANGLLEGNPSFFITQTAVVLLCSLFSFGMSYALIVLTNSLSPVKIPSQTQDKGLDELEHKEVAYSDA